MLKCLNASPAVAILRDPPETNQMTTRRKEGRFRWEVGSQLFGQMTRAKFASLLGIGNPSPRSALPGPVTERTMPTPVSLPLTQTPIIKKFSFPSSSRPPSRLGPRSHSLPSKYELTHHDKNYLQHPIHSGIKSYPKPRARELAPSKLSSRSDSRLTGSGENIIKAGHGFLLIASNE